MTDPVPQVYDVSLNGRGYVVDDTVNVMSSRNGFRQQTAQLLRAQADNALVPSENSVSPDNLWRRSAESWHHGAGQNTFDRPDSDPYRFRSSVGVDVWTRYQLGVLNGTHLWHTGVTASNHLLVAGSYLYVSDNTELYWTQDVTATPVVVTAANIQAGEAAQTIQAIASDGHTVWASLNTNGIHQTVRGATTSSHYSDLTTTRLGWVKGRLMAANGPSLYNVVASGAAPAALMTHANNDWTWVGFAPGPGQIYAAGYSGDKSLIYRTAVKADATALDAPVVAGELPDGEIVTAIDGYLGFVLIGTSKGLRLAAPDSAGNLTLGALIPTSYPVRCFEGQDRFVWFGWEKYNGTLTGLGRLDLSTFTTPLTPAYASDLMAFNVTTIDSIVTFQNLRVFTASNLAYVEAPSVGISFGDAYIDSGLISFGMSENKNAVTLDVKHPDSTPLPAHKSYIAINGSSTFTLVGTHTAVDSGTFSLGGLVGETFEIRTEVDTLTLNRWTLRAQPVPERARLYTIPLQLYEVIQGRDGQEHRLDVATAFAEIDGFVTSGELVTVGLESSTFAGFIVDYDFLRMKKTADGKSWQGACVVVVKKP